MNVELYQWVFYFFCGLTLASGLMVVTQNHPVRSVLFLVLTFFSSAVLWLMLEAEFLSLILLLVYVGAVMTLFLFVVMMLHVDIEAVRSHLLRVLPLGGVIVLILTGLLMYAFSYSVLPYEAKKVIASSPQTYVDGQPIQKSHKNINNTAQIGEVLYTNYVYPFELAAVILLVAMISAITLTHREITRSKRQDVRKQIMTQASERVRLVSMASHRPGESS